MDILNPHSARTLKEDHSCFLLPVLPTPCSLVAAECLLLSSLPPLLSPHQSLPGGASSSTPTADFQTLEIPLRVAYPQLPPCIWRAESQLTPPFSETWLVLPGGGLINPCLHSLLCCRRPSFYSSTPLNSCLTEGEADVYCCGLRHQLLSRAWSSRTRGLLRL
jgi:hypothetical protein